MLLRSLAQSIQIVCFFILSLPALSAACVDSALINARPVQCYGLRNGAISIDSVYGGEFPLYYSIDGQSFSTNRFFENLWPGNYTVYIRDASGCIKSWTTIVEEPEQTIVELVFSDTHIESGSTIQVKAEFSPADLVITAIHWRPPFLVADMDTLKQSFTLFETTEIAIEISDKNQCIARDRQTIQVEKSSVFVPNALRPGSNQNAYFTVYAGESVQQVQSLQVFSRSGGLLFEKSNFSPNAPLSGWNGRFDGQYVQTGVYPWVAVVQHADGSFEKLLGTVTVIY